MEKDDHHTVLAVSHGGACFHFMRNWVSEEKVQQIMSEGGFPNCTICKYEYEDQVFKLIEVIRPCL